MKIGRSLAAVLIFLVSGAFAQQQVLRQADYYANDGKWKVAIPFYEDYLKKNDRDARVQLKLAKCYVNTFQDELAQEALGKYVSSTSRPSFDYYLVQGQFLQQQHQFKEAIKTYKMGAPSAQITPSLQKKINECYMGMRLVKKKTKTQIVNLGKQVNSKENDLLPKITANEGELFFSSYRSGSKTPMDVYVSRREEDNWGKPDKLRFPINTNNNEACVGLSIDGLVIFLYKGSNGGDLFTSLYQNGKWQIPVSFPFNTSAKESSVTISPDGLEMIFVRKVKGKTAQLWYSTLQKDSVWSTPQKFVLDTPYDDETPYFHADGNTLFFSSKGTESMGGYDVLMSKRVDGVWQQPENLGYPINSAKDEIGFVVNAKGDRAYYSSLKSDGFGEQDIYRITLNTEFIGSEMKLITGVVKSSQNELLEASIQIVDLTTDQIYEVKANDKGQFLIALKANSKYGIRVKKSGYLFYSDFFETETFYQEQNLSVVLTKEEVPQSIVLRNVFFESGQANLDLSSHIELDEVVVFLMQNETKSIQIIGHTDNVGDEGMNRILSENRALSVKNYLIEKGVAEDRISAIGNGASLPLTENITEEGKAQNRRIEMKVLD